MKKTFLSLLVFLTAAIASRGQDTPFKSWLDETYITSTYITKLMLDFAPNIKIGGTNLETLKNKIEQVEIYTNEEISSTSGLLGFYMRNQATEIIENEGYLLAFRTDAGRGSNIRFYTKSAVEAEEKPAANELIMLSYDPTKNTKFNGLCIVIRLIGDFTGEDIKKIAGN